MAARLKWPVLGVVIPSILIAVLSYGSHYFVFRNTLSCRQQWAFEGLVSSLWLSYLLAIIVSPGSPPKNFKPGEGEWKRWCKKCKNYKPERSHHCKTCNVCVLKMDHHCPWTLNCVGHKNLPHFMRFLTHVIVACMFVLYHLGSRAMFLYDSRNMPSYLIDQKELVAVIVLLPLDIFVLLTIILLYIRNIINYIFNGMTQLEVWEMERLENQFYSERMWIRIRRNYFYFNGKEMPELKTWNRGSLYIQQELYEDEDLDDQNTSQSETDTSIIPTEFTPDDFIFPYDLGMWSNIVSNFGNPLFGLLPWACVSGSGLTFDKNEFALNDQLNIPWPPDGGAEESIYINHENQTDADLQGIHSIGLLRKKLDPRLNMTRKEWMNDEGETLDYYGVDIELEECYRSDKSESIDTSS